MKTYHAKITAPKLRNIVPRERLFSLLDRMGEFPVTWVSSQAGSGKTVLLASYLERRGIPFLWYRVDETDGDPAGLFYYMSEAAKHLRKGRRRPLPLFTPEYLSGMFAFTRYYFESLFGRMTPPYAIVLDNYQDAPEFSLFHEAIKNSFSLVPSGIRIFVASRNDCPPSLVSLRVGGALATIGWEDIRFTLDEVTQMLSLRTRGPMPQELMRRIHRQTHGWAAGAILLSEQDPSSMDQHPVFDYLAEEVFRRLPETLRAFLLTTSLLPSVSPELAVRLTGVEESETLLARLRGHYFTERYGRDYSYHPLFRQFLLVQAKKTYGQKYRLLAAKAGEILAQGERREEAIKVLLDAEAYEEALPLIIARAPELLKQGRSAATEACAARMPDHVTGRSPWLSYWLGMGRLVTDPASAGDHFKKAFELSEAASDRTGAALSAAGMINSIVLQSDDYRRLDPWVDWAEKNVGPDNPLPSPDMEAYVASAMVGALMWTAPWHPNMEAWVERALKAAESVGDPAVRFMAKANVMTYYGYCGRFLEMRALAEEFRQAAFSPNLSPLAHLSYMTRVEQLYDWVNSSWKSLLDMIRKAVKIAEEIGARAHLGAIYISGMLAAFELDDLDAAYDFIRKSDESILAGQRITSLRFSMRKTFYLFRTGNLPEARREAEDALREALETGCPLVEMYARILISYVLRLMGEPEEASRQLLKARDIIKPLGVTHGLYLILLTEAILAFDRGERSKGLKLLKEAFEIGRTRRYDTSFYFWWQPAEMARLCAEAFAEDIEVEYAKELVRTHRLMPEGALETHRPWPWPVRIYTLGRFGIEINGTPLTFSGKVQKKPLALLKALVALGGKDIRREQVCDWLWPESEGDRAHSALKKNVFRVRRLLGDERAISLSDGKVALDPRYCWVDVWAFQRLSREHEALLKKNEHNSADRAKDVATKAMEFYERDFLADEDEFWMAPVREKLKAQFFDLVQKTCSYLERKGKYDEAEVYYRKAYALDPLREESCQHLMLCLQKLGRPSEAADVYHRCRAALSAVFNIQPSKRTEEIYSNMR